MGLTYQCIAPRSAKGSAQLATACLEICPRCPLTYLFWHFLRPCSAVLCFHSCTLSATPRPSIASPHTHPCLYLLGPRNLDTSGWPPSSLLGFPTVGRKLRLWNFQTMLSVWVRFFLPSLIPWIQGSFVLCLTMDFRKDLNHKEATLLISRKAKFTYGSN